MLLQEICRIGTHVQAIFHTTTLLNTGSGFVSGGVVSLVSAYDNVWYLIAAACHPEIMDHRLVPALTGAKLCLPSACAAVSVDICFVKF